MSKQNEQENESLVTYWRQKLDWYMQEATAEEYNEEEVRALKSILEIVESEKELDKNYYNAEKSLERFMATLDMRLQIQDEMRRLQAGEVSLADYPEDDETTGLVTQQTVTARKYAKRRFDFRSNAFRKVAMAASLVATLVIGGTVGAYAHKEGFFKWLSKDDGKAMITESMPMDMATGNISTYTSIKDIPDKYKEFMWIPNNLPVEFQKVEVLSTANYTKFDSKYGTDSQFFNINQKIYKNGIALTDTIFDGYTQTREEEINEVKVEYFEKDNDGVTEHLISFYVGNEQYLIKTSLDLDEVKEIVVYFVKLKSL